MFKFSLKCCNVKKKKKMDNVVYVFDYIKKYYKVIISLFYF